MVIAPATPASVQGTPCRYIARTPASSPTAAGSPCFDPLGGVDLSQPLPLSAVVQGIDNVMRFSGHALAAHGSLAASMATTNALLNLLW